MTTSGEKDRDGAPRYVAARLPARSGVAVRVLRAVRRRAVRGCLAITAALWVAVLAGPDAAAPAAAAVAGNGAPPVPGAQLWASSYNGTGNGASDTTAVAAAPGGSAVFVTGLSAGPCCTNFATVAYDAATGAQLWTGRYHGPGDADFARAVAVSPDGRRVFVTGFSSSNNAGSRFAYATVAYNAATGAQLWARRYNGPENRSNDFALAVSPGGRRVFVTGLTVRDGSGTDYETVAYNAATGAQLWASRYTSPGNHTDFARAVAVSPDGGMVFVTGDSHGRSRGRSSWDYATVACRANTGARLWVSRYNGPGVTGFSGSGPSYVTIAYRAATGATRWVSSYRGEGGRSVAAAPDGHAVYVTGTSGSGYGTVAYDAATGAQLWAAASFSAGSQAAALAVGPAGNVYVTGTSNSTAFYPGYGTVAYQG
jgi:DNA-binding beta-propeller fold protein YncE